MCPSPPADGPAIDATMGDDDEIRALIDSYAAHADDGDTESFAGLFLPDAVLRTWPVDGTVGSDYRGRADIAAIPAKLAAAYDTTVHRVGRGSVSVGGSSASATPATAMATTSCEAHHVRGDVDRVLTIRYDDTFERDTDGRWRFAAREVHVVAVEDRAVEDRAVEDRVIEDWPVDP
jgi:uncharacterized protein (TIGR02246 family)